MLNHLLASNVISGSKKLLRIPAFLKSLSSANTIPATGMPVWKGLYWVAAIGLLLRIVFALTADNFHHPDEIFQYQEQAHRLVFGYGYIPWEYRFGIRSWLLPFIISIPLYACKFLSIDQPAIYIPVVKIVFCILSTTVIFSSYAIARNLVSEKAGRLAAIFSCFWYELIYFSSRSLTEVVGAYFLLAGLALAVSKPNKSAPYLLGFCAAFGCALRLPYIPLLPFIFLPAIIKWKKRAVFSAAATFIAIIAAVGFLDYLTWGGWFVSYYNNYVFNQVYGISYKIFGASSPYLYIFSLVIASSGVFAMTFLCGFFWIGRLWSLIGIVVIIVGIHSHILHKEYRHIFIVLPIMVIIASCCISMAIEALPTRLRSIWLFGGVISLILAISCYGMLNKLPYEESIYRFKPLYAKNPMLLAYTLLSSKPNVNVIDNSITSWWDTGGYYYLHRNIPVYTSGVKTKNFANVTHTIIHRSDKCGKHFARMRKIGYLKICERVENLPRDNCSPQFNMQVLKHGIDGVYNPTVKPFF